MSDRHCNYSDPSRKALYAQCTSANNPQNTQKLPKTTNKCAAVRKSCKRASSAVCNEQRRRRCHHGSAEGAASPPPSSFFFLFFSCYFANSTFHCNARGPAGPSFTCDLLFPHYSSKEWLGRVLLSVLLGNGTSPSKEQREGHHTPSRSRGGGLSPCSTLLQQGVAGESNTFHTPWQRDKSLQAKQREGHHTPWHGAEGGLSPRSTLLQQGVAGESTTLHTLWQRDTSLQE